MLSGTPFPEHISGSPSLSLQQHVHVCKFLTDRLLFPVDWTAIVTVYIARCVFFIQLLRPVEQNQIRVTPSMINSSFHPQDCNALLLSKVRGTAQTQARSGFVDAALFLRNFAQKLPAAFHTIMCNKLRLRNRLKASQSPQGVNSRINHVQFRYTDLLVSISLKVFINSCLITFMNCQHGPNR